PETPTLSLHDALPISDLHIDVTPDGAVARDGSGAELWHHAFPADYITAFSGYGKRSEVVGGRDPAVFIATGDRIRRSDGVVETRSEEHTSELQSLAYL